VDGLLFPRRLPHQPKIDMDFIFDEVMAKRLPLDRQRIAESPYDVRIVLSDVEACRPVVVQLRSVADRADEYLKAGAWLPILAGPPYLLNGRTYLDGGVLRPDPLYAALAEGCTHVLMLNTVPEGAKNNVSPLSAQLLRFVLNRWRPELGDAYLARRAPWAADKARLRSRADVTLRCARVVRLCPPPGAHSVDRVTVIRERLLDGARVGYTLVNDALGPRSAPAYFSVVLGR
jgi:predicted patatin/cPLA2 family phospholipase